MSRGWFAQRGGFLPGSTHPNSPPPTPPTAGGKEYHPEHEEKQVEKPKSLFICGNCGKEDKEHIQKVILAGYADMLCFSCRALLEDTIADIARSFLGS